MKHGYPGGNKVKIWQKFVSPTSWPPPHPLGHGMSVKCEQPIDELTVQGWLLYHHPNFKYYTLFVSRTWKWEKWGGRGEVGSSIYWFLTLHWHPTPQRVGWGQDVGLRDFCHIWLCCHRCIRVSQTHVSFCNSVQYCTELRTDRLTDKWMDGQTDGRTDWGANY